MGREIKRVPMDFSFPLGKSYADEQWFAHKATCPTPDDCDCDYERNPPKGDGWQLWQTVSNGPITPVYATPEELIEHMCRPAPPERAGYSPWDTGWRREVAEHFVRRNGWAPSFVLVNGQMMDGATFSALSKPAAPGEEHGK
jgi:hypothetical protein